jgi:hypothetical protein
MPVNEPSPNGRGFLLYGGSAVRTSYGHPVRVQESSSAEGPHVWLFTDESDLPGISTTDPHLSLADAIEIRDRLTQFINGVPERWTDGKRLLREARKEVATRRATEREGEEIT